MLIIVKTVRILVDEMHQGLVEKLREKGHYVESVKELINQGRPLRSDYSVLSYAKQNDLILVSADIENQKGCKENNIKFVSINQESLLEMILNELDKFTSYL
jgi:rRNA-processing protein FCF1